MSSTLDNLQWKVEELQEKIERLEKQRNFLLGCIEAGLEEEDLLLEIKQQLKNIK